jgi:hypothetical protein
MSSGGSVSFGGHNQLAQVVPNYSYVFKFEEEFEHEEAK